MKKILLFLMTICAFASMNTAKAQGGSCQLIIENVIVTKVAGPTPVAGGCEYTFNASFDILSNAGFKYLYFHSWTTGVNGGYGSGSFDCTKTGAQNPPTASRLGTSLSQAGVSFMDFGLINLNNVVFSSDPLNPTNITANIATTYQNDNTVALNYAGATATVYKTATTSHYEIKNITVIVPGNCGLFAVITDVWGSNANSSSPMAQCYICGLTQSFNDPTVSLLKICGSSPFQYDIGISTESLADINVTYRLYAHNPLLGVNAHPSDPLIFTSQVITLKNTNPYDPDPITLPAPYCCMGPWSQWDIYAKVAIEGFSNEIATPIIATECATLPVNLKYFNADRKNVSTVELKWETAQEQNSEGFYVQRKLSNGGWQNIDFVESKATNGNSNTPLAYTFTDLNNAKGVSQYRLRQLDIDGKTAYSLIRSVRGEGQKANTIIYPNPSSNGKVNVVFESGNTIRDVSLMDMSGKTLKQWKGVTNNNIQIDNLNPGFYTVRILNTETGEQVVEKFIVNKR